MVFGVSWKTSPQYAVRTFSIRDPRQRLVTNKYELLGAKVLVGQAFLGGLKASEQIRLLVSYLFHQKQRLLLTPGLVRSACGLVTVFIHL